MRRPNNRPANSMMPEIVGQVVAYEADKSITIEIKQRGGQSRKSEFTIAGGQTQIELVGDTKAITVGMSVSITTDKDNPSRAAKIVADQAGRPRQRASRPSSEPPRASAPATPS